MKNIKIVLFISLLIVSGLFNSCKQEKKENTGNTFNFENIHFHGVNTPLIEIELNGNKKMFIVDTGANMSLIDEKYYENNESDFLYLNEVEMTLNGVSGAKEYKAYYVLGELGNDIKYKHQFLTSDLTAVKNNIKNKTGVEIAGILGADYLNRYGFTVDFVNKAMYVHQIPIDTLMNINNFYN